MSVRTRMGLTPESKQLIERRADRVNKLMELLHVAVTRVVTEVENNLKTTKLRGGSIHEKRNGNGPLASRSGNLMQAAMSKVDQPLSGFVGFSKGLASSYAAMQVGPGSHTITPKTASHLWIPIADNLTGKGVQRMSPREFWEQRGPKGGKLAQIIKSKAGNLVAMLSEKSQVPGVRHKRSRLMFVLKKSVTVQGTDGLAEAARERIEFAREQFYAALQEALA